jgi:hypothetical protein
MTRHLAESRVILHHSFHGNNLPRAIGTWIAPPVMSSSMSVMTRRCRPSIVAGWRVGRQASSSIKVYLQQALPTRRAPARILRPKTGTRHCPLCRLPDILWLPCRDELVFWLWPRVSFSPALCLTAATSGRLPVPCRHKEQSLTSSAGTPGKSIRYSSSRMPTVCRIGW